MNELEKEKRNIKKELSLIKMAGKLFRGKDKEIKNDFEKIEFLKKGIESLVKKHKVYEEQQTELQSLLLDKEIGETVICRSITNMLAVGIDDAIKDIEGKSEPERFVNWFLIYCENYPSLKTKIIKELPEKHLQIEDEIREEYEKWKMEEERKKKEKS